MNYKNKKIIFSIISLVMILTIVISPLGSIVSNAEEISLGTVVSNPFTVIELPSTMLQRDSLDDHSPFIYGGQYNGDVFTHLETVYNWWLSDGASMTVRDGQFKWYGQYFILKGDSNNWNGGYISSVPEGSFFVGYYDYSNNPTYAQYRLYVPKEYIDDNNITKFPMWWGPSMLGTDKYSTFESPNDRTVNVSDNSALVTIDGDQYYYFSNINTQANNFILQTSLPVYVRDNYNFDEISDLGSNVNPNYSGSNSLDDEIENHLLLGDNTKFYISNSSFNNGTLYLYPVLDTTQLGQNESLDDYFFRITGTVQTTCTYNSGIKDYYASNSNGTKLVNHFPMSSGGGNSYNFTLQTSSGSYYDFPVTDASSGEWSMSLSDFNNLFYSSTDYTYYDMAFGLDSLYSGTNFWIDASNAVSGQSIMGVQWFKRSSDVTVDVEPDHVIYNVNLSVYKKNRNTDEVSEGSIVSVISGDICDGGLSGENLNTSSTDSIKNALGTDYVPSGYDYGTSNTNYKDTYNNVGGAGGSSSSNIGETSVGSSNSNSNANIGDGAIVINNNPTFNNDVSSSGGTATASSKSSGFGSFLSTIISLIALGKSSSVDTITDLTGATGFMTLANTYLSSIPVAFWTTLLTTFTAVMGIMVVAFIIKIAMKIFLY